MFLSIRLELKEFLSNSFDFKIYIDRALIWNQDLVSPRITQSVQKKLSTFEITKREASKVRTWLNCM